MTTKPTKPELIAALYAFIRQRPGLDPRDYISDWRDAAGRTAYRSEARSVTQQLNDARALLRDIELRDSITVDDMLAQLSEDRRLSWNAERGALEYITGQYWPTEYRAAVCGAMASVLWAYRRDDAITGADIRRWASREFGRGLAGRWFN